MSRRLVANLVSLGIGLIAASGAFYAYYHLLSRPRSFQDTYWGAMVDWAVDLCAGFTVGIIFFFVAWGHFQSSGRTPARQESPPLPPLPPLP